jgi:DNA-binding response OmpR family regulator
MRSPLRDEATTERTGERPAHHVLLADDEAHSRLALTLILRRAGYAVVATESSLEAVVGALAGRGDRGFDLLVIDPQGAGPTSDELQRALARLRLAMPVLFIDGSCSHPSGCAAPGGPCLEKPFRPDEFLHRIALLVGEAGASRGSRP